MTLKVCARTIHWISNVREVMELHTFEVAPSALSVHDGIYAEACKSFNFPKDSHTVWVAEFEESDQWGKILKIERDNDKFSRMGIIPANQCFLLGDTGKTIDRI